MVANYGETIQRQNCKAGYQAIERESENGSQKKTNEESHETKEGHWHRLEDCGWTACE